MRRAVFLDRDGTLIANDGDLGDPSRVRLLPGAAEACAILRGAVAEAAARGAGAPAAASPSHPLERSDAALVVVTNQGGVARGAYDETAVERTNDEIESQLRLATGLPRVIDAFYHCPFHPEGTVERYRREHPWRKPAPGMLFAAARDLELDLARSWLVGDAERDVLAGRDAGCRTILLASDPSSVRPETAADFVDSSLLAASRRIEAAERADLRPRSAVRLRAKGAGALADPALRDRVLAVARSIAERTGVEVVHLAADPTSVEATLVGDDLVAIGFAAELRRTTESWYRARTGASLWSES